jgi:hypothetical protein
MARIPIPDRGQPLDVSYIYTMATAINELAQQSSSSYKYTSIDTVNGREAMMTSDAKIVAGEKVVYATPTAVTSGSTEAFSYSFNGQYKYPPIVTASPVIVEGAATGDEVSVIVQSITNSRIDGIVKFNVTGSIAIKIHIIAVGVAG